MAEESSFSFGAALLCFVLVILLALAESWGMSGAETRVGLLLMVLGAFVPGIVVGLLTGSARRGAVSTLLGGLPAFIVVIMLLASGPLTLYTPFPEPSLVRQTIFRLLIFSVVLILSMGVGHLSRGEPITRFTDVEVEEMEKKIEQEVVAEKLSGISLVERPQEEQKEEKKEKPELPRVEEVGEVPPPPPVDLFPETKSCPTCGSTIPFEATFCPSCGERTVD